MFNRLRRSRGVCCSLVSISLFLTVVFITGCQTSPKSSAKSPLRVLLVTGGCCHNYKLQSEMLTNAVGRMSLAGAEWKIVNEGGSGTKAQISLYDDPNWAKGFDVVVH